MHGEPFTVLVVEDNPEDVVLLQQAFTRSGSDASVQFVEDGEEAIDYLSGVERFADRERFPEPDIVVMDLKMPGKGGFEVLEWFRNLQEGALIPVVVLTSSARESDVQHAYSLGANTYFTKPASFEELRDIARTLYEYWSRAHRPKSHLVRR